MGALVNLHQVFVLSPLDGRFLADAGFSSKVVSFSLEERNVAVDVLGIRISSLLLILKLNKKLTNFLR